jgi:hypothetical protein
MPESLGAPRLDDLDEIQQAQDELEACKRTINPARERQRVGTNATK